MDKRMPNETEAKGFKTAVLQAASTWLSGKPALAREHFSVDIEVEHTANASETLQEYYQRDTGDEAK